MASRIGILWRIHGYPSEERGTDSPCLLSKYFQKSGQDSRCKGLIFQANINQVEKRCALGK